MIDEAGGEFGAKNAAGVVVDFRHGDFAGLHGFFQFGAEEIVERLFVVETGGGSFFGAVCATPIGDDKALEAPLFLENVGEQIFIFAGEVAVDGVVGAHHRPGLADLDADFEGEKVAFAHGALADDDVDFVAAAFLIVKSVMLDVADDVLALLALDAIADHDSGEDGILAHVLEGPAIAGFAGDVNAAAEGHVVALGAKFAADERAVFAGGMRVPTGSSGYIGGQSNGETSVFGAAADAIGGVAHLDHGNAEARNADDETGAAVAEIPDGAGLAGPARHAVAVKQFDFFVEGHLLEDHVGALVGR